MNCGSSYRYRLPKHSVHMMLETARTIRSRGSKVAVCSLQLAVCWSASVVCSLHFAMRSSKAVISSAASSWMFFSRLCAPDANMRIVVWANCRCSFHTVPDVATTPGIKHNSINRRFENKVLRQCYRSTNIGI